MTCSQDSAGRPFTSDEYTPQVKALIGDRWTASKLSSLALVGR